MDLIIAALLREMSGLSGKAIFECVVSSFAFNRCSRQGSVEAPRLWQKMASQIWANVEEEWMKQRKGVLMGVEGEGGGEHQICSFMWTDNFWIMSRSKKHLEQMLEDLIKEPAKVDWEPKPASLWWTSHISFRREGKSLRKVATNSPVKTNSGYWGVMNRQGNTCDAVEERMQSADKAFWKDTMRCKSKDVPWRITCQRLVDHVYAVFSLGSEKWSWTQQTLDKIKGGKQNNDEVVPLEKTKRGDVGRIPGKNHNYGQEDMGADELV